MTEKQSQTQQSDKIRPPVVVVLGHVDHGKTSILDFIRKSKVAEKESGGITQHVGAYEVEHPVKAPEAPTRQVMKKITFLDTPGHEAFSAMRARGSHVADIAILVVAADEGVRPQTKEAIEHIKKAGIPHIVAMNKIDKPEANIQKVMGELAKEGIVVEKMGGQIPAVAVSAKTGQGIDELLDMILLVAEVAELHDSNPSESAKGVIIESYLDSLRGPTATLLVREGSLCPGSFIATPSTFGKVKSLENFQKEQIENAVTSQPAIVTGFEDVPHVGEKFEVFPDIAGAQKYMGKKETKHSRGSEVIVVAEGQKVLHLILKADVAGSLEAVEEVLKTLPQEKVIVRVLESSVGEVTEADLKTAQSGKTAILAFRVKVPKAIASLAERGGVPVLDFSIIYELTQKVRELMELLLSPEIVRKDIGKVEVLALFGKKEDRQIIGGKVVSGEARRLAKLDVERNGEYLGAGKIVQLQHDKKDVESVAGGNECGILFDGEPKVAVGDMLKVYTEEKRKQLL